MTVFAYLAGFWLLVGGSAATAAVSPWFVLVTIAGLLVTGHAANRTLRRRS